VSCPQRGAGRACPAPHEAQTRSGQTARCGHVRPESSTVSSCCAKDLKKAPASYSQSPTCAHRGRRSAAAATAAHQTRAEEGAARSPAAAAAAAAHPTEGSERKSGASTQLPRGFPAHQLLVFRQCRATNAACHEDDQGPHLLSPVSLTNPRRLLPFFERQHKLIFFASPTNQTKIHGPDSERRAWGWWSLIKHVVCSSGVPVTTAPRCSQTCVTLWS